MSTKNKWEPQITHVDISTKINITPLIYKLVPYKIFLKTGDEEFPSRPELPNEIKDVAWYLPVVIIEDDSSIEGNLTSIAEWVNAYTKHLQSLDQGKMEAPHCLLPICCFGLSNNSMVLADPDEIIQLNLKALNASPFGQYELYGI